MGFRTTLHALDGPPMSGQIRPVTTGYIIEGQSRVFPTMQDALDFQAKHMYHGERPEGRARRPRAGVWTPVSYEQGGSAREQTLTHIVQAIALITRVEQHLQATAPQAVDGELAERTEEFEAMMTRLDKLFWALQSVTMQIESAPGIDFVPPLSTPQRSLGGA